MSLDIRMFFPLADVLQITAEIIRQNRSERDEARAEKKRYIDKFENASGEEIFKLMNLISLANMDEFVAEARLHAQQAFKICMFCAAIGFFIICVSVGFAIYFQIKGIEGLSASYLGSAVGLITEAISAIFFTLYTRTTTQVNRFYDRLLSSNSVYSSLISTLMIDEKSERNNQISNISHKMMDRAHSLDQTNI